jgi:hypothetical protein
MLEGRQQNNHDKYLLRVYSVEILLMMNSVPDPKHVEYFVK